MMSSRNSLPGPRLRLRSSNYANVQQFFESIADFPPPIVPPPSSEVPTYANTVPTYANTGSCRNIQSTANTPNSSRIVPDPFSSSVPTVPETLHYASVPVALTSRRDPPSGAPVVGAGSHLQTDHSLTSARDTSREPHHAQLSARRERTGTTTSRDMNLRHLPSICPQFSKKSCKSQACQRLHLCADWLTGSCPMVRRCRLPHSLSTAHNLTLLRARGWRQDEWDDVRLWLCFQVCCQKLEAAHLPPVCVNHARGFCQAQPCDALHMCPRFLVGVCEINRCSLSHDLFGDENNRSVVVKSGNGDVTAKKLLKKMTACIGAGPQHR